MGCFSDRSLEEKKNENPPNEIKENLKIVEKQEKIIKAEENQANNYKIEQNTKIIFLTLLGFPFPNQEYFYFDSPDNLIAQLSLSKEFLFDLLITNKNEYDTIKSNYDSLNKNINLSKNILIIKIIAKIMLMNKIKMTIIKTRISLMEIIILNLIMILLIKILKEQLKIIL